MIEVTFATAANDEVGGGLMRIQRFQEDLRPVWPAVVERLRAQELDLFRSEGSSGEQGRWAALTEPYATQKARKYPGTKILERTGRLRESLTHGGGDSIVVMDGQHLFFGSEVPYAGFHQEGTTKMARRAPLSPTTRDVAEWIAEIHRAFDRNVFKGMGTGQRVSVQRALVGA